MSRNMSILLLIIMLTVVAAGCSSRAQDSQAIADAQRPASNRQTPAAQSARNRQQASGNAPGQMQPPDLTGEVASVSAGKVSVKLIKIPTGNPGNPPSASSGSTSPAQGKPSAQGQPPAQGRQRVVEYTGETKTLEIPSGTKITMMSRDPGAQSARETVITELKTGDMIQVWFSDTAQTVVSRINVIRRANP